MSAVISVQKHTITLAAGQASNSAPLTGTAASNTGQCIPFITSRVTTITLLADTMQAYAVDAYFLGSTVVVATGQSDTRAMVVEVTVVEFDSAEIDVQWGTYTMAVASLSDTPSALSPAINEGTTFLYHTWQINGPTSNDFDSSMVRGEFTGAGATVTFTREASDIVGIGGHYYTAEATAGTPYWTVKPVSVIIPALSLSNTGIIPGSPGILDLTKAFLIGSHSAGEKANDVYAATSDAKITDVNTVTSTRLSAEDTSIAGQYFVVEFKSAAPDAVQRGTFAIGNGASAPFHTVTITPVTEAASMVHVSGTTGGFTSGNHNGAATNYVPDAWVALDFISNDTVQMTHLVFGGQDPYNVTWEVIEWDMSGAPASTRRVFIIS